MVVQRKLLLLPPLSLSLQRVSLALVLALVVVVEKMQMLHALLSHDFASSSLSLTLHHTLSPHHPPSSFSPSLLSLSLSFCLSAHRHHLRSENASLL